MELQQGPGSFHENSNSLATKSLWWNKKPEGCTIQNIIHGIIHFIMHTINYFSHFQYLFITAVFMNSKMLMKISCICLEKNSWMRLHKKWNWVGVSIWQKNNLVIDELNVHNKMICLIIFQQKWHGLARKISRQYFSRKLGLTIMLVHFWGIIWIIRMQ